ncbi:MAG: diguanylate cyclase [Acetatifactor sp.]|nr:diguanylate cyclase [Acetatifactor sp.]
MAMTKAKIHKIRLLQILLLLFCFLFWGLSVNADESSGRVLFISSYSYAWDSVQLQIEGMQDVFGQDVVLDYEFMDTKRVSDEEALQLFHDGLKYRLEHVPPYDVVILGDDAALLFAMEYQEELFPGIPLVFEGVNDEELAVSAVENPYITGIIEVCSVDKNIELGLAINPKATKVVAILDDTITGEAERKNFYSYAANYPNLIFSEINTSSLSTTRLRQAIRTVNQDSILIYASMTEDASGVLYTNREAVAMLYETAKVPVYRMVEGGIGEGVLGGNIVSMHETGCLAGQIAMDIIGGADVSQIGIMESPNVYCVDMDIMTKFDINPSVLPENTILINDRGSFFQHYREVLIPGIVLLVMLMGVVLVVCVDNLRRRKILSQLENARKTIETASQHDFLTGISNRSKFMSDLTELIEQEVPCTVIMMDIDDFKHINDSMGHKAGDEALQQVASRMKEMESQILTPYRYAGDEFIMILRSSQDKIVEKTAYQCRQIFTKPFILNKTKSKICGSIGIASYPKDTENLEELIIFADAAMYQVKRNGKNDFAFYRKEPQGEA